MLRVSEKTTVSCDALGVHAYVIRKPILSFVHISAAFLEQIARVHLSTVPAPSEIKWTHDKGVVGRCWATGREVKANLEAVQGQYADCTEAEWDSLPSTVTFNLSFEEFRLTVGKYGCVVATPIVRSDGRFLGCISLDGPASDFVTLSTTTVHRMLQDAAESVAGHLSD